MLSLLELQRGFARAVLAGDASALDAWVEEDGLASDERLAVHRNNVVASLTTVLADTFPVVRRLVDERFFAYAAYEFIGGHPPARPCLAEYGAGFADFLASFPPCRALAYLPDVARLEWLLHRAANAADAVPLAPTALQSVAPEDTHRLAFRFAPSVSYLASPWPVDRIWRANRACASDETIDLAAGGARLEIRRRDGDVEFVCLPAAEFAFRAALSAGHGLGAATQAALAEEHAFDLAPSFARLLGDGVLTDFSLTDEDLSP